MIPYKLIINNKQDVLFLLSRGVEVIEILDDRRNKQNGIAFVFLGDEKLFDKLWKQEKDKDFDFLQTRLNIIHLKEFLK